jgi:hypothetical protein
MVFVMFGGVMVAVCFAVIVAAMKDARVASGATDRKSE